MTRRPRTNSRTILIASLLAGVATACPAWAQDGPEARDDDEIVVTAQKREENLQDVPLSITALGTEKLEELQVSNFNDYARYLPSVSFQTIGPGAANVYFRGVASGENANHSTSLPSVGTYLDEQPITTIQGALDIHVYDIARVEALAGPQGTLFGASSQAGTVRIITNKPDTSGFYGAADVEVTTVSKGGIGYVGEAFVNLPISDRAALRVVGWYDKDAGFIDNVPGTIVFPTSGATITNAAYAKEDYNDVETYGGRAALKIDLDDNWTIQPTLMAQRQQGHGFFGQESGLAELQVQQYHNERFKDEWYQAALTIEGRVGAFDVTYAGAYLKRYVNSESDYSEYAYFYDAVAGYGAYYTDNLGNPVNPDQYFISNDRFNKQSHELRFNVETGPVQIVGGVFYQRQQHNIQQDYIVEALGSDYVVPGTTHNIWLTKQLRVDRDYAGFAEITADVTDKLSVKLGARIYKYDNSLVGFFGYGTNFGGTGERQCFAGPIVAGSPCTNLDKRTKDTDFIHKINITYKATEDVMFYATASRGFRPGGINRRGTLPPYQPDFIDNYEIGWKTSFLDNMVRFNGAIYQLDWNDIQLSFLGANGLSEVRNAGVARIRGAEFDLQFRPVQGLSFSAGGAYNDAKITTDFCKYANLAFDCTIPGPDTDGDGIGETNSLLAPAGTRLPITAKFKGNVLARYEFPIGSLDGHFQGSAVYEGKRTTDLRLVERAIVGDLDDYVTADFSAGLDSERWSIELFVRNAFDSRGALGKTIQCSEGVCGDPGGVTAMGGRIYTFVTQPRTIGLRLGTKF